MKSTLRRLLSLPNTCLVALLLAITPLRAQTNLHYLAPGKPDAAIVLTPPLLDSAEQSADMDEVRTIYHAASSNDMAIPRRNSPSSTSRPPSAHFSSRTACPRPPRSLRRCNWMPRP